MACDTRDNCQNKNITLAANRTPPPPKKRVLRKYSTKPWFQHQSVQTQTSTALYIYTHVLSRLLVESSGLNPTLPILNLQVLRDAKASAFRAAVRADTARLMVAVLEEAEDCAKCSLARV